MVRGRGSCLRTVAVAWRRLFGKNDYIESHTRGSKAGR